MSTIVRPKVCLLTLLLCSLLCGSAWGQERKSTSELREAGILTDSFQPIIFSHNERWLACFDEAPFKEKKEGIFYRLWFFEIGPSGSINRIQRVPIEMKDFLQGEFTPNDDAFVILGNRGTTFLKIDLKSFEVSSIMTPKVGEAGFRADPTILWTENGTLYTIGYPYDEARFIDTRTIASLDANASGPAAFKAGPDIGSLEKTVERMWFANYMSPTSAFYGQSYSEVVLLSHWDGQKVTEFDRAQKVHGSWGNSDNLLYSVDRAKDLSELLVFDSNTNKRTVLASGPEVYRYLFLSQDGKTALASLMVPEGRRLLTFFARASEGWTLRPLEGDVSGRARTVAAGWMRLSSRGKFMAHVTSTGLALYSLPR